LATPAAHRSSVTSSPTNAAPPTTCASNSKPPAASTDERNTLKSFIEGLLLKHEAKRWAA
jgi:hypothetical protein